MTKKLSPEEAGRYLGSDDKPVPTSTLAWWRCKGKGPAYVKVGARVLYLESELDAFISAGITDPKEVRA